jgi:glutamate decarboxylase
MVVVSLSDNERAAREPNDMLQRFDADRGEFVWLERLIAQHSIAFFASNRFKPGGVHPDAETTFSMVDLPETVALSKAHAAHLLDDVFSRVMSVASPTFVGLMQALR